MQDLSFLKRINAADIVRNSTWIEGYYSPVDGSFVAPKPKPSSYDWKEGDYPYFLPRLVPGKSSELLKSTPIEVNFQSWVMSYYFSKNGYIMKTLSQPIAIDKDVAFITIGSDKPDEALMEATGYSSGNIIWKKVPDSRSYLILLCFYDENDNFIKSTYTHWLCDSSKIKDNTKDILKSTGFSIEISNQIVRHDRPAVLTSPYGDTNVDSNRKFMSVAIRGINEEISNYYDYPSNRYHEGSFTNDMFEIKNARKIRISIGIDIPVYRQTMAGNDVYYDIDEIYKKSFLPNLDSVPDIQKQQFIEENHPTKFGSNFYFDVFLNEYNPPPPPPAPVVQDDYIIIYPHNEPQDGFKSNGLAVLQPSRCEIIEELNGGYYVEMEHPVDEDGKWKYIQEFNILKVRGQLFRIRKNTISFRGNSGKVTSYAEHIFYDLNDEWVFDTGNDMAFHGRVEDAIGFIMAMSEVKRDPSITKEGVIYDFNYSSDAWVDESIALYHWVNKSDSTVLDLIIGSDGVREYAEKPTYLYRDNFHYSINYAMEGARDNAFEIRVGVNAKNVSRTVDVSTFASYFKAQNNNGEFFAWAWYGIDDYTPHAIVRSETFNQDRNDYSDSLKLLEKRATNYFFAHLNPEVSYTIDFEDVRFNPEWLGITLDMRFKVGDKGRIIDERIGFTEDMTGKDFSTYQISKTVTDGRTGKILQVMFGSQRYFTHTTSYDYNFHNGSLKLSESSLTGAIKTNLDETVQTSTGEDVEVLIMGKLADYDTVDEVNSTLNMAKQAIEELAGINVLVGDGIEEDENDT